MGNIVAAAEEGVLRIYRGSAHLFYCRSILEHATRCRESPGYLKISRSNGHSLALPADCTVSEKNQTCKFSACLFVVSIND